MASILALNGCPGSVDHYNQYRAECLLGRGIRLLRFSNREVLLELPAVLERIYLEIVSPSPLAPLPEGEGK